MPSIPAAAHVVAWLALGTGVGVVLVRQRDLSQRLDAMEVARESETPAPAAAPLAGGKEVLEARARLDEAVRKAEAALDEGRKLRSDHDRLVATVMATPEGSRPAEPTTFVERPGFEDAVRGVIDRYATEHKFRETVKKAAGPLVPKKPAFVELAKALKLSEPQASRLEQDVRSIQQELFELLQSPREDGVVPLEEIQQAEQYPEGDPKRTEAFLKLVKLTIPGTQETYMERAVALVSRVKASTKAYLDDGQRGVLDTLDLDWFGIRMP